MNIAQREQQILRVKAESFQTELDAALEQTLRTQVVATVKATLEAALDEEVQVFLKKMGNDRPRRSGFFERKLDTQYGHIPDLRVPKLRRSNRSREWKILQRYQRSLGNLLDWTCCLYVMGLSLRIRDKLRYRCVCQ